MSIVIENNIPKELIIDLCKTSYIIYNYMDKWKLTNFENFENNINNNISDIEKNILSSFNKKYNDASVYTYITNESGLQCFILKNPKRNSFSLIFRGTESIMDCFCDLLIYKHNLNDDVKVHYGFYKQLTDNKTLSKIIDNVNYLIILYPTYKWNLSGHSLGGALATLCGYILAEKYKSTIFTVVSFGSPRIGNLHFRNAFNKLTNIKHYRAINENDIIPTFPYFGFYHCGYTIHYKNDKWTSYNIDIDNNSIFNSYNIKDHLCSKYIENIEKLDI